MKHPHKKRSVTRKITDAFKAFAVFILAFNAITTLGSLLGVWSTPSKQGLLPYEAPNMQAFKEIFIKEAFAS